MSAQDLPSTMSGRKVGTAIVGLGKVAHTHARALAALAQANFTAVCSRHEQRAASFARQYGVRPYTNLAEMLRDPSVQAITVCTPHPQHAGIAILAAEAGVHVLVEKPMATRLADCDRMIEAARSGGVKLGVISQRRLYPPVLRVKQAIEDGKIGAPALGVLMMFGWRSPEYYAMDAWRGTWEGEGGGVLVNQAVHQLDLFQWFMGPVAELFGYWDNLNHPSIEVEDTALAVMRFQNGALGNIVVSNSQNPGMYGKIHVHGRSGRSVGVQTESGSAFIAGVTTQVEPPINDLWTVPGEEGLLAGWQERDRAAAQLMDPMTYYHQLQIEDFLMAVLQDREPLVTGEEGRKAVELFEAIYVERHAAAEHRVRAVRHAPGPPSRRGRPRRAGWRRAPSRRTRRRWRRRATRPGRRRRTPRP
jgi:predicted dehydrogenase